MKIKTTMLKCGNCGEWLDVHKDQEHFKGADGKFHDKTSNYLKCPKCGKEYSGDKKWQKKQKKLMRKRYAELAYR